MIITLLYEGCSSVHWNVVECIGEHMMAAAVDPDSETPCVTQALLFRESTTKISRKWKVMIEENDRNV